LTENKLNDNLNDSILSKLSSFNLNEKLKQQHAYQTTSEHATDILNTNLIKRKDLLKTINYNKLHKNFISNSSSVDEGVESDFSSPTQSSSFSNDLLSSITTINTQFLAKQQQQQQQQQQILQHASTSPPLTPPLLLRKTRAQTSNRSINNIKKQQQYIINSSSSNSINSRKSFNPYDLSQIKRELKKLIKVNSESSTSSNNSTINSQKIKLESHLVGKNKQQVVINNDKSIGKTISSIKNEKTSKSSNNLVENSENCCKYDRKFSLK
jgi:hypothetical protein